MTDSNAEAGTEAQAMDEDAGAAAVEVGAEDWKRTLDHVTKAVVVLKVTQCRACDTEPAGSSFATGFVVDKKRGLILTNRHVVTPGPVVAEAIFLNREEVDVKPLFFDPVHDFGFFRFDPGKLQFMEPAEVPLNPEGAAVGLDIRVVGNDSGEKISILSGTLARLDRDAPHYTKRGYNDFNTFYLQAASGTKGGSSGSPVVNIRGEAVGLNAGGKNKAASAFYLPLHRVVRALRLLQACKLPGDAGWLKPKVPRGDLHTTFVFKGFDEVRRLGLRQATEAAVREDRRTKEAAGDLPEGAPGSTGMLTVDSVVPGGPADGKLEPGDVLVRLGGRVVTEFLTMEAMLDDCVGQSVSVEVERGGTPISVELAVRDLHAVTPDTFLDLGGGSVHSLSYQQARNNRVATGQVYVAEPGYLLSKAGLPKYGIITSVAGTPTPDLPAFIAALKALDHGQRVPLQYFTFGERHRKKSTLLHVDWNWYGPPLRWTRNDASGVWDSTPETPNCLQPSTPKGAAAQGAAGAQAEPISPRISSPHIQAAGRPPLPPRGGAAAAGTAAGGKGDAAAAAAAAAAAGGGGGSGLPRKHSVAALPQQDNVELMQAGVTAQADDARLAGLEGGAAATGEGDWRLQLEEKMRCALVQVSMEIPLVALADGVHSRSFGGCGVVVHHSARLGLVLVDRNTVAIGPGDILLSFGAFPAEVAGRCCFLHPLHNFALVHYDPSELPDEARSLISAAPLAPTPSLARGESVELVCLSSSQMRILHRTSLVTNPAMSVSITQAEVPRFRAVHEEVVRLDLDFGAAYAGVLTDRQGNVRALWGSYSEQVDKQEREWTAGLPVAVVAPWLDRVRQRLEGGEQRPPPTVRVLNAELQPLLLSKATLYGLPTEWVSRLMKLDPERRQVLRVRQCAHGSHAQQVLREADMVLAIGGRPVSSFRDVELIIDSYGAATGSSGTAAGQVPASTSGGAGGAGTGPANGSAAVGDKRREAQSDEDQQQEQQQQPAKRSRLEENGSAGGGGREAGQGELPDVPLTIFRDGKVMDVGVRLGQEDGLGTDRLVHWCGAQLQYPHRAVRESAWLPERHGIYISRWHHGSPAHRYGLYALHFITEVNGIPTPDMDTFLSIVGALPNGADVRVGLVHHETTRPRVLTLKTDTHFWPTFELRLDPASAQWTRTQL